MFEDRIPTNNVPVVYLYENVQKCFKKRGNGSRVREIRENFLSKLLQRTIR